MFCNRILSPVISGPRIGAWAVLPLYLAAAGCSQQDDFGPSRAAVAKELRDPASAEFRNEEVRTLWTKSGRRLTVYCGEVNAANAFGGKTGFQRVTRVIDHANLSPGVKPLWEVGEIYFDHDNLSPTTYLNCIRADTERGDANFGKAVSAFDESGKADKAEIDRMEPVLSNRAVP